MAKAFKHQYEGEEKRAKNYAKMSLVLRYSLQMGPDGPRLFLKRCVFFLLFQYLCMPSHCVIYTE